jgi:D-glycero-D-manno-heptose 1,7-bisphosphate phosphatase
VSAAPAVLVDRDGTLIEDRGYIDRIDRMDIYPYSIEALRVLQRAGYKLVVVTNQAGVARGMYGEDFVHEGHAWLRGKLEAGGVRLDGVYYCPHHAEAAVERYRVACDCRKPKPGMALQAAEELGLDLTRSFVIGDRWIDVELASRVGARGILVRTGYGAGEETHPPEGALAAGTVVVDHVHAAATWILRQGGATS